MAAALTGIYLAGLIARPKRVFGRMGIDSLIVIGVSAIGFAPSYQAR